MSELNVNVQVKNQFVHDMYRNIRVFKTKSFAHYPHTAGFLSLHTRSWNSARRVADRTDWSPIWHCHEGEVQLCWTGWVSCFNKSSQISEHPVNGTEDAVVCCLAIPICVNRLWVWWTPTQPPTYPSWVINTSDLFWELPLQNWYRTLMHWQKRVINNTIPTKSC